MYSTAAATIEARLTTPGAQEWLATSVTCRVLHVFGDVVDLANERDELLVLATDRVGPGPNTLIVDALPLRIGATTPVVAHPAHLLIGDCAVSCGGAEVWSPIPAWQRLRSRQLPNTQADLPAELRRRFDTLLSALPTGNGVALAAGQLAGLGNGLTPAGDDLLVGTMHALWVHGCDETLMTTMADAAATRTTTVSAAMLRAAAGGEATWHWHALVAETPGALDALLSVGHNSGVMAWHGFARTLALFSVDGAVFRV